jgi:hypothetical protein
MTNLFDTATADGIKTRLGTLRADAPRQWGTMTAPQALAHCADSMAMATGDIRPKRMMVGRLFGPVIKRLALGNEEPMRRNSPTVPELVMRGERDLDVERDRLVALIDRFVAGGPGQCTTHPHAFFGRLTPEQWGELMYKHLDHHLRQFGA